MLRPALLHATEGSLVCYLHYCYMQLLLSCDNSTDGRFIATASEDGSIRLIMRDKLADAAPKVYTSYADRFLRCIIVVTLCGKQYKQVT
jgi:hypothetical protein